MSASRTSTSRADLLRGEVGRLRAREVRRRFPVTLQVGDLGGAHVAFAMPASHPREDRGDRGGLRFAVVEALLARWGDEPAELWITRPGVPQLHDVDHPWWAAGREAFGARGVPLTHFTVLTRAGWLDPATGESRAWKRLRLRDSPERDL